jgi:hypothetical protein
MSCSAPGRRAGGIEATMLLVGGRDLYISSFHCAAVGYPQIQALVPQWTEFYDFHHETAASVCPGASAEIVGRSQVECNHGSVWLGLRSNELLNMYSLSTKREVRAHSDFVG